jgi:parvulin-like peptidyl-prolyl isomerase
MRNVLIASLLVFLSVTQIALAQNRPLRRYVSADQENLRAAPNGQKIGTVMNGVEAAVIEERGNWAKIMLTAWIWKPSLSNIRPKQGENLLRALHILVKEKSKAENALAEINSGKEFREVAKEYSILPNASQGGDLGYFEKGDFDPTIEQVIEALEIGSVSGIVETEFGYNIFKRIR